MRTAVLSAATALVAVIASVHFYWQCRYTAMDLDRARTRLKEVSTEREEAQLLAERIVGQYSLPLSEGARKVLLGELVNVALTRLPRGEAREAFFLVLAIESRFGTIQKQVSSAGATGIAQIMPKFAVSLAEQCGMGPIRADEVNLRNVNLALGACHFAYLYRKYNGNIYLAMAGYNAGMGRIGDGTKKVPDETAHYVSQAAIKRGK